MSYPEDVNVLTDQAEVLLRQIPVSVMQDNGEPMSGGFIPGSDHAGMLSTLRGAVGAEEAFKRWDGTSPSAGTWGIEVGDAVGEGLTCVDDAALPDSPKDHSSVDFNALSNGKRRQAARKLREFAVKRRRLHPPVE